MEPKTFLQFNEGGIVSRDAHGVEKNFLWHTLRGIKKSAFSEKLWLVTSSGKMALPPERDLLLKLFGEWRKRAPEEAKKAGFDYVDTQRAFTIISISASLLFAFPLAFVQLNDSLTLTHCSTALQERGVVTEMQITKMSRKNDGPFLLDFTYEANGTQWKGKDQFIVSADEKKEPPTKMPIVYDRDNPSCWSLTPTPESHEVNWAKRRFFAAYTLLFGIFFILSGLFGLVWGLAKFREKRPFTKDVKELFQIQF